MLAARRQGGQVPIVGRFDLDPRYFSKDASALFYVTQNSHSSFFNLPAQREILVLNESAGVDLKAKFDQCRSIVSAASDSGRTVFLDISTGDTSLGRPLGRKLGRE